MVMRGGAVETGLNGEQVGRRDAGLCESACECVPCSVGGGTFRVGGRHVHSADEPQPINSSTGQMSLFPPQLYFHLETPFHWGTLPRPQGHGQIPGAHVVWRCGWREGAERRADPQCHPSQRTVLEDLCAGSLHAICSLPTRSIFPLHGGERPQVRKAVQGSRETPGKEGSAGLKGLSSFKKPEPATLAKAVHSG